MGVGFRLRFGSALYHGYGYAQGAGAREERVSFGVACGWKRRDGTHVDGRPVHDVCLESLVDLIYNLVRDRLPA